MAHYALDDPRLADEMARLAAAEAEGWPVTDETLAKLAGILPAAETVAARAAAVTSTRLPQRRAA